MTIASTVHRTVQGLTVYLARSCAFSGRFLPRGPPPRCAPGISANQTAAPVLALWVGHAGSDFPNSGRVAEGREECSVSGRACLDPRDPYTCSEGEAWDREGTPCAPWRKKSIRSGAASRAPPCRPAPRSPVNTAETSRRSSLEPHNTNSPTSTVATRRGQSTGPTQTQYPPSPVSAILRWEKPPPFGMALHSIPPRPQLTWTSPRQTYDRPRSPTPSAQLTSPAPSAPTPAMDCLLTRPPPASSGTARTRSRRQRGRRPGRYS